MAERFFDTSAAVKHYRPEIGTAKVDAFLAEPGSRHFISDLTVVEFHSVLARLVRSGVISLAEFQGARGRFLADIVAGLWQVESLTAAHFQRAQGALGKARLDPRPPYARRASACSRLDAFRAAGCFRLRRHESRCHCRRRGANGSRSRSSVVKKKGPPRPALALGHFRGLPGSWFHIRGSFQSSPRNKGHG